MPSEKQATTHDLATQALFALADLPLPERSPIAAGLFVIAGLGLRGARQAIALLMMTLACVDARIVLTRRQIEELTDCSGSTVREALAWMFKRGVVTRARAGGAVHSAPFEYRWAMWILPENLEGIRSAGTARRTPIWASLLGELAKSQPILDVPEKAPAAPESGRRSVLAIEPEWRELIRAEHARLRASMGITTPTREPLALHWEALERVATAIEERAALRSRADIARAMMRAYGRCTSKNGALEAEGHPLAWCKPYLARIERGALGELERGGVGRGTSTKPPPPPPPAERLAHLRSICSAIGGAA